MKLKSVTHGLKIPKSLTSEMIIYNTQLLDITTNHIKDSIILFEVCLYIPGTWYCKNLINTTDIQLQKLQEFT